MKKITYDKVKQMFEERGYELLSIEYINSEEKMEYICSKHRDQGIQRIDYNHLKRGQGCRFCGKENKKSGKQKDLSEYNAKELTESKGMEFVEITRENSKLYIYYVCPKHRQYGIQKTMLESMRRKKVGCPYCVGRHKTTETFKQELLEVNSNIEVVGEYINAKTGILCKCVIDGHEWSPTPNTLLSGEGCPVCGRLLSSKNRTKTNKRFLEELASINPTIIPCEQYADARKKINVYCDVCGYNWSPTPDFLLQGGGCPECSKLQQHDRQAKSHEQFVTELKMANPMLTPLEHYYNDYTKILIKCELHNYIWSVAPNKILHRNTGCPKCVSYTNEKKLLDIFDKLGYSTEVQKRFNDCKDKNTLPFDIYVKELNLLVEYDGEGHYQPIPRGGITMDEALENLRITQRHDAIKTQYCLDHNIPLIRIPYWERNNMESYLYDKLLENNLLTIQN